MPFVGPHVLQIHGPADVQQPLLLDSPHSGCVFPADFGAAVSEAMLRSGEDCFVDQLFMPATTQGLWLLAAQFPRTYVDANRHEADIDLALLEHGHWPDDHRPSWLHAIGKGVLWRTLDDGRPIYQRRLSVAETRARIQRCHRPYHQALRQRIEATQAHFGHSWHINCHSMNSVGDVHTAGTPGQPRPDFVLGDMDGRSCEPAFTRRLFDLLSGLGYHVTVNDPFKGLELVGAYSDPAAGRHSLQLEINKRLYMDENTKQPHEGFVRLQRQLETVLAELNGELRSELRRAAGCR